MDASVETRPPPAFDSLPPERRAWAAVAVFAALAMASLDTAIANIALPAISADLKTSPADAVWVVNVYQIGLMVTLLPLGALGEIVGHKRIYLGGLILFTVASLLCALAWSLPTLLVGRVLQGLGAGGIMSVNTALVRYIYPPHRLGRGYGHNALVVGTAFTLGPTIASGILSFGSWPWLFAINVPFGIAAILIGFRMLPQTPRASHQFDFPAALLAAGCIGFLVTGIGSAAHGAALSLILVGIAAGIALGWIVIRRQANHPAPMLPIDLFRRPMFALSTGTAICSFAVQGLAFVSLPFYFEDVLGRSQVETGFFITPWPLVVAIMAPIAGRMADRYHVGGLGGGGLLTLGIGMALLATLPDDPSIPNILWRIALCGIGFGFFQAPNMKAIMISAPPSRAGGASSIVATARLTGQTTGAALAALCFNVAGPHGATLALALGAIFATVGSVTSFIRLIAAPGGDQSRDLHHSGDL